jgi:homoserine dehydrogenase
VPAGTVHLQYFGPSQAEMWEEARVSRVTLVQVGMGTVGGETIEHVIANRDRWWETHGLDVRIGAVIGLGGALVTPEPDGLGNDLLYGLVRSRRAGQALREAAAGRELVEAPEAIAMLVNQGPVIVMDAAAGDETAPLDARALASGAGVVLSNKAPLALPLQNPLAAELWATAGPRGHLRYEATCGAGLPVISTLRSLLDSGDEPIEIVGALSGTLGAIFTDLGNQASFSQAVRAAKANGFTEPDPRDDLSGLDVARKALILARTIGRRVNLDEIAVENLVPEALQGPAVGVPEFMDRVGELDAEWARRAEAARASGATLKYVATIPAVGPIAVGVREVPTSGLLGALQGPENVVVIRTARYDANPLTIVGPGAGAAVTAAGMTSDMLALGALLTRRG